MIETTALGAAFSPDGNKGYSDLLPSWKTAGSNSRYLLPKVEQELQKSILKDCKIAIRRVLPNK
jgi:hypothetical protein